MAVRETLELDLSTALSGIGKLDARLQAASSKFQADINASFAKLQSAGGGSALGGLETSLTDVGNATEDTTKKTTEYDDSLAKVDERSRSTTQGIGGLSTQLVAVGAALGIAVKFTLDLESALAPVGTLLGANSEAGRELTAALKDVIANSPQSAEDIGASAYTILSAGISGTTEVLNTLGSAQKLSEAGLGTLGEATDLVTSAINSFKGENLSAQSAAELLFGTISLGKTTVADLAQGFGGIAPLASAAGVSFKDLLAATGALTGTGQSASEAYTGLRGILTGILRPTKDAAEAAAQLGIDFSVSRLQSVGFAQFLNEVQTAAGGNVDTLTALFGSVEGLNAALALTGPQAAAFAANLEGIGGAGKNLNERAKEIENTVGNRLKTAFNSLQVSVSALVLPALEALVPVLQIVVEAIGSMPPEVVALVAAFVLLAPAVTSAVAALTATGTAVTAASFSMGQAALAAGAFTLAFVGTTKALEAIFGSGTDFDKLANDFTLALRDLAKASNQELVPAFEKAAGKFQELNENSTPLVARLTAFREIAKEDATVAFRLLDALDLTGSEAHLFEAALAQVAGQQAATDDANAAAEGGLASLADQFGVTTLSVEDLHTAMTDLENSLLGVPGAALNLESSLIAVEKAQRDLTAAQEDGDPDKIRDAQIRLEEANLRVARSVIDLDAEQSKLNDSLGGSTQVLDAERQHLIDLQTQFPQAAGAIQPLIDKLDEAARLRLIAFFDNIAEEQQRIQNFLDFLAGAPAGFLIALSGGVPRQSGGPVPGTFGQPVPILAHGGEFVLSADVVRAIKRGGPTEGLTGGGGATVSRSVAGSPLIGTLVVQGEVPNAVKVAKETSREARAFMFLGGHG